MQQTYDTDWAIEALHDAEAEGFTGTHICQSAAGWEGTTLTPELTAHLLRDGAEAAKWLKAWSEHPAGFQRGSEAW